jgi:hypothetical protein
MEDLAMKYNDSSNLISRRRSELGTCNSSRRRLAFETLESRRALSIYIEDFALDEDSTLWGFDFWDAKPETVPGGDTDADLSTRLGPDDFQIPHEVEGLPAVRPFVRLDDEDLSSWALFIYPTNAWYEINFTANRDQPGGLGPDREVVAVGFDFLGGGRIQFFGDNGEKTVDVGLWSDWLAWDHIAVTSNDPSDSGAELGAIQRVRITALPGSLGPYRDFIRLDNVAVILLEEGFANNPPVANDDFVYTLPDHPITFYPLANDADADGDAIFLTRLEPVGYRGGGLFISGPDEEHLAAEYTPYAGFHGVDVYNYFIKDSRAPTEVQGTIRITVNTPPPAREQTYHVPHGYFGIYSVAAGDGLLPNLIDADGDPLTLRVTSPPQHGTLKLRPDGSFEYLPQEEDKRVRSDRFQFVVNDGYQDSEPKFVFIDVSNAPPVASDDYQFVPHGVDTHTLENPAANDEDPERDQVVVAIVHEPRHGTLSSNADGTFLYTASGAMVVPDSFTYRLTDVYGQSDTATVQILVPNRAPVAMDDRYTIAPEPVLEFAAPGLLANDIDLDQGDADRLKVVAMVKRPNHGTVTLRDDGSFTYVPHGVYRGVDTFGYVISDGIDESRTGLVEIIPSDGTIFGRNDWVVVDPDVGGWHGLYRIFDNDWDPAGLPLSLGRIVQPPTHGALSYVEPGAPIAYQPVSGFEGTDIMSYTATNGISDSQETFIVLRVDGEGSPLTPRPQFRFFSTRQGVPLEVSAGNGLLQSATLQPGWRNLYVELQNGPRFGTFDAFDAENGTFTYVPNPGFAGDDRFTYFLYADYGDLGPWQSELESVSLHVLDQRPQAEDDTFLVEGGTVVTGNVRTNDDDPDDPTFAVKAELVSPPAFGFFSLRPNGEFYYRPTNRSFVGSDQFTYRLFDGARESDVATVRLNVIGPQAPVARHDVAAGYPSVFFETDEELGLIYHYEINVTVNDYDMDGDPLTVELVEPPKRGFVRPNSTGSGFLYTLLDISFIGNDVFTYRVTDGLHASNVTPVTVIAAQPSDGDYDGVQGGFERAGPNGGDGNHDNVSDDLQSHVTSLPTLDGDGPYVTLEAPPGNLLIDVHSATPTSAAEERYTFPRGFLDFQVLLADGENSTTVTVYLSPPTPVDVYLKSVVIDNIDTWVGFLYNGTTGAQFFDAAGQLVEPYTRAEASRIVLHFIDGGYGDQDGIVNGQISDPGGPALIRRTLAGDFNGNGRVEQADLDLVLLNWGLAASQPPSGWTTDLPSGRIEQDELDAVLLNWGEASAAASVLPLAFPRVEAPATTRSKSPVTLRTGKELSLAGAERARPGAGRVDGIDYLRQGEAARDLAFANLNVNRPVRAHAIGAL